MQLRKTDRHAMMFNVIDADTGEKLKLVTFADDQTGEYEQAETDEKGNPIFEGKLMKTVRRHGNIRIVPARQLMIYIAGPYTAHTRKQVKANIARAEAVAQRLLAAGYIPIIPHKITSFWDEKGPLAHWRHTDWLERFCLPLMDRCDAAFFIEKWEHSDGATIEYHHAADTRKPRFFDLDTLCPT